MSAVQSSRAVVAQGTVTTGWAALAFAISLLTVSCGSSPDAKAAEAIYERLLTHLRNANSAIDLPDKSFDSMGTLVKRAGRDITFTELSKPCNGTMSYSMSALSGKIAIYVKCNNAEKRGDWVKP